MFYIEKASKNLSPVSCQSFPLGPESAASRPIKSLTGFNGCNKNPALQGTAGRDTGAGLDMYVVFNSTPPLPYVIHAGNSERPLNKLTSVCCGSRPTAAGG